jgi:hypothetical protein
MTALCPDRRESVECKEVAKDELTDPEQERRARRRADRERLRQAAEQLLTPEGWMRWIQARSTFRSYSAANCMLLAQQCHERRIVPQLVHGPRDLKSVYSEPCLGDKTKDTIHG